MPSTTSCAVTSRLSHSSAAVVATARWATSVGRGQDEVVDRAEARVQASQARRAATQRASSARRSQSGARSAPSGAAHAAQRLQRALAQRDDRGVGAARGRGRPTGSSATTRPGRGDSTTTRSASSAASSTSWVTSRTVRGSRASAPASHSCISRAGERVERAERLVEAQHRLARQQRAQERDALAHAARQLVGPGALEAVEAEAREQRVRALARLRRGSRRRRAARSAALSSAVEPRQQQVALGHQHRGRGARPSRRRAPAGRRPARAASSCRSRSARRRRRSRPAATCSDHVRERGHRRRVRRANGAADAGETDLAIGSQNVRGSCAGASSLVAIAPSAGITPQVRRVSAGVAWALSQPASASPPVVTS